MRKEPESVVVYPTKESSYALVHESHGPLVAEGTLWPLDSFTLRRLNDGSVSREQTIAPLADDTDGSQKSKSNK